MLSVSQVVSTFNIVHWGLHSEISYVALYCIYYVLDVVNRGCFYNLHSIFNMASRGECSIVYMSDIIQLQAAILNNMGKLF